MLWYVSYAKHYTSIEMVYQIIYRFDKMFRYMIQVLDKRFLCRKCPVHRFWNGLDNDFERQERLRYDKKTNKR